MRKQIVGMLTACVLCLAGCSSTGYSWDSGVMSGPKGTLDVNSFEGYKAETTYAGIDMSFYMCDSIEDCGHNTLGVAFESMTPYKKDAWYYEGYLGTQIWMFTENDTGGYIECNARIPTDGVLSTEAVADMIYEKMKTMSLSDSIPIVDINGVLDLKTLDWDFILRPTEVIVPKCIRIKMDDGSVKASKTETLENGKSYGIYEGETYTYYIYEGLLIQIATGLKIESFLEFK